MRVNITAYTITLVLALCGAVPGDKRTQRFRPLAQPGLAVQAASTIVAHLNKMARQQPRAAHLQLHQKWQQCSFSKTVPHHGADRVQQRQHLQQQSYTKCSHMLGFSKVYYKDTVDMHQPQIALACETPRLPLQSGFLRGQQIVNTLPHRRLPRQILPLYCTTRVWSAMPPCGRSCYASLIFQGCCDQQ